MQDFELKKLKIFKYLGSILSENGDLDDKEEKRIQAGWMKCKTLSGVLCDKRLSERTKGKVFKVAVRPAMPYSAERAIKKTQQMRMNVAEIKMLRFAYGHTRLDKIEKKR
jgi:hypothetical protein